jgi:tRNA (Thr-GGU) A37 N-methylase
MNRISEEEKVLVHPRGNVGIFATRAPIRPNPVGLTLVKLVKRAENTLYVRQLDALDNTPVLVIKPYPDWEQGQFTVITDFKTPSWLAERTKF